MAGAETPNAESDNHRASGLLSAAALWTSRQCGRASPLSLSPHDSPALSPAQYFIIQSMAADKLLNLEDLTKEELEPKATFARLAVPKAVQPEKTAAAIEEDNWRGKGKIGSG